MHPSRGLSEGVEGRQTYATEESHLVAFFPITIIQANLPAKLAVGKLFERIFKARLQKYLDEKEEVTAQT